MINYISKNDYQSYQATFNDKTEKKNVLFYFIVFKGRWKIFKTLKGATKASENWLKGR